MIAGFVLGNSAGDDRVIVRGLGPSLSAAGIPVPLANPTLELRDENGALLVANNDWQDDPTQTAEITAAGLAPTNNLEAAIAAVLPPGFYTTLLAGLNNGTGIGLVEVYDRGVPGAVAAQTINLSTRLLVGSGDRVGIGGFIITGTEPKHVLFRAIGPSLSQSGVSNVLSDPVLELRPQWIRHGHRTTTGETPRRPKSGHRLPPTNDLESAIDATLAPGAYTAIVRSR